MAVGNPPKGPGGKPIGLISPGVGFKVQTPVLQPTKDKLNVQDLITCGKKEKLNVGTRALITGQPSESSGSGKQQHQSQHVNDLITGRKGKLNVGTSGKTSGKTSPGEGSISPKLQIKSFNQTNQTSTGGSLGKQKIQTEVLHLDKEKSKVQDWGSSAGSANTGSAIRHRGKH